MGWGAHQWRREEIVFLFFSAAHSIHQMKNLFFGEGRARQGGATNNNLFFILTARSGPTNEEKSCWTCRATVGGLVLRLLCCLPLHQLISSTSWLHQLTAAQQSCATFVCLLADFINTFNQQPRERTALPAFIFSFTHWFHYFQSMVAEGLFMNWLSCCCVLFFGRSHGAGAGP